MKRLLIALMVLGIAACAWGNGVSLNSPGTRALSMAGAVISNVSDYSVAYWNPSGLMNTEGISASFFLTDIIPLASYEYEAAGVKADGEVNHYLAPNAAFLWSCMLNPKVRLGLSFLVPAGLGSEWDGKDFLGFNGPAVLGQDPLGNPLNNLFNNDSFSWKSDLDVWNISLSGAYKFGEKLNVGAAFHLVNGKMILERGVDALSNIDYTTMPPDGLLDSQYEEESDGWGYGVGLGFQYMINEKFTLGAMMRSRMTVGFEGDAKVTNSVAGTLVDYTFERDITMPLRLGGGITFRPNERWLLAAEALWTQWSETEDYLIAEHDAEKDTLTLLWDDALQIRFGGEYVATEDLALRGGFYWDPAPGPDETQTILIPNATFLGFTMGAGYTVNKFTFDFTLEFLKGYERDLDESDVLEDVGMPGVHGLDIWAPSIAVTYKFK